MKKSKKWLMAFAGIFGMAVMIAFQMSLNIGVGPWDGLSLTLARMTNIKVGDMTLYLAIISILVQLVVLRSNFKLKHFMQLFVGIFMGEIINLFYYFIFSNIRLNVYPISLLLFIMSVVLFAFFVSLVQVADAINLPLEGMTQVLAEKFEIRYSSFRFGIDIVSLVLILVLVFAANVPNTIREGTIISAVLFGPALGKIIPWMENKFN